MYILLIDTKYKEIISRMRVMWDCWEKVLKYILIVLVQEFQEVQRVKICIL